MSMELLKVVSQILEFYVLIFLKIKIPPMSPGLILHRLFVLIFTLQAGYLHVTGTFSTPSITYRIF